MTLKAPKNSNYCATVVEIKILRPLENSDRLQAAIIFGNQVIVGLDTKVGDVGLYFPVETQLSHEFVSSNNLYRKKDLNVDKEQAGYFEENRRVRAIKLRRNKSEGIFLPLDSITYTCYNYPLSIGDEFDELMSNPICNKYIPKNTKQPGQGSGKINRKAAKGFKSKLVDNQFRFHQDTSMLYKNLNKITPDSLISITYKMHGTSGISSKIICKKKLNWREKLLKKFGVNIIDTQYDYIYSSRKVIKNEELNPNANHFYGVDIWGLAHKELEEYLQDGMTLYYEIVGFLPNESPIQNTGGHIYDYGYPKDGKQFGIYIYRITYTNPSGKVFEFSAKQVQDWCHFLGLNAVPQLYYGQACGIVFDVTKEYSNWKEDPEQLSNWRSVFLEAIKERYNDHKCYICKNDNPEEGAVIRLEKLDFEAYKQKSFDFYALETKDLDKGTIDIETEN